MRAEAAGLRHVSGERIGGGLAADGMGELSKLLLGSRPAEALRIARDTGALVEFLPEYASVIGHDLGSARQPGHARGAPLRGRPGDGRPRRRAERAPLRAAPRPRQARRGQDGRDGPRAGRRPASPGGIMRRLRYPNSLRDEVCRLVAGHAFWLDPPIDGLYARRFLASHGFDRARRLLLHKRADLHAKHVEPWELREPRPCSSGFSRSSVTARTASSTSRWTATTCSASGTAKGPCSARLSPGCSTSCVDDPVANDRETLLAEARQWLP